MAIVEGRGCVAPAPVAVPIPRNVFVTMQDEAERRENFRRYGQRSDQWGRGLTGGSPALPILVGLVGEWAFAEFVNTRTGRKLCETDFALRKRGDGGCDFRVVGVIHQLKTRQKLHGENLIRRRDESGNVIDLLPGRYVFAQWEPGAAVCRLLGWCLAEVVVNSRYEPSPRGRHSNLRVEDSRLESMSSLIAAVRADIEEDDL